MLTCQKSYMKQHIKRASNTQTFHAAKHSQTKSFCTALKILCTLLQGNVLLGENGTAVLSDFGIAKVLITKAIKGKSTRETGTYSYMYVTPTYACMSTALYASHSQCPATCTYSCLKHYVLHSGLGSFA